MGQLVLKRASASRPSGHWYDDDYDVLCEGEVVGRIIKAAAAPVGQPWLWTLAYGYHEDRTPTHGYEPTREAAMGRSLRAGDGDRPRRAWARRNSRRRAGSCQRKRPALSFE